MASRNGTTRRRKRRNQRQQKDTGPATTGAIYTAVGDTLAAARGTASRSVTEAYNQSPWLRAVVSRIGDVTASVPLTLCRASSQSTKAANRRVAKSIARMDPLSPARRKATGEHTEEIYDHPILDMLDNGNLVFDGVTGRALSVIHRKLTGNSVWLIERSKTGMPTEFWPLPQQWIEKLPESGAPYYTIRIGGESRRVSPDDIIWFRDPNPASPYGFGVGVGMALRDELDTDEYAAKMLSSVFQNRAIPDAIIAIDGASQDELERAKQDFQMGHRGVERAGRTFWHSGNHNITQLTTSFKDLQMTEIRSFEREAILTVFGYPPELLGLVKDATRASVVEARRIRAEEIVIPSLRREVATLQKWLVNPIDPTLILGFEDPRPQDQEIRLEYMKANAGTVTINEWREAQGLDPIEGGEAFLRTAGVVVVPVAADLASTTEESESEPSDDDTDEDIDMVGGDGSGGNGGGEGGDESGSESGPAVPAAPTEGPVIPAGEAAYRTAVIGVLKVLDESDLPFMVSSSVDEAIILDNEGLQTLEDTLRTEVAAVATELGISMNRVDPMIAELVESFGLQRTELLTESLKEQINLELAAGINNGEGAKRLAARIEGMLTGEGAEYRAMRYARTEVGIAANEAREAGYIQAAAQGVSLPEKEWIATRDKKLRNTHRTADGQRVKFNEDFQVGAGSGPRPGAIGLPEEDIHCRCTFVAVPESETRTIEDATYKEALDGVWKAFDDRLNVSSEAMAPHFTRWLSDVATNLLKRIESA